MPHTRFDRFLPASGILAGLALAGGIFATHDEPSLEAHDARPYVDWAQAHHTQLGVSAVCGALFTFLMLMFAAQLRASIRAGEGGESTYSSVAFAGGIGVALSLGGMSLISAAQASADATAAHTLAFLADAAWLPWAASSGAMLLGTGLGALRTVALPKWLAVVTVVLGVLSVTGPTGIAVFVVTPLWLIATGVVLARRQIAAGELQREALLAR